MLIQADAAVLPYADKSFHTVVTSPPYWGLRKYAGEQGEEPLGLEATPERHIERMVDVFREVRRVLRDDGVVWLNYGDCYAAGPTGGLGDTSHHHTNAFYGRKNVGEDEARRAVKKNKTQGSLMLMPHRLAIALQDDGWIVRNDLVWFKRNPMPESVAGWRWERTKTKVGEQSVKDFRDPRYTSGQSFDNSGEYIDGGMPVWEYGDDYVLRKSSWRHTRAHEYVFQLVKKMGYYCNQEAVREVNTDSSWATRLRKDGIIEQQGPKGGDKSRNDSAGLEGVTRNPSGRNPRSVMDVPTAPYKGAHYATFPPKLIAPLIRASCPRRACPECGQAWAAVVERGNKKSVAGPKTQEKRDQGLATAFSGYEDGSTHPDITVKSYRPTCECGHEDYKPGKVLDIFGGSGTTGMVAKELLRDWVIMDISRPYLDEQAKVRTGTGTPTNALENLPMFE